MLLREERGRHRAVESVRGVPFRGPPRTGPCLDARRPCRRITTVESHYSLAPQAYCEKKLSARPTRASITSGRLMHYTTW